MVSSCVSSVAKITWSSFGQQKPYTGAITVTGTAITKILPPASRFDKNNGHAVKKQAVLDRLSAFFERYFSLA